MRRGERIALVIGSCSRPIFNLGWVIGDELNKLYPGMVGAADFNNDTGVDFIDVRDVDSVRNVFELRRPQVVVYAAGINRMLGLQNDRLSVSMTRHFNVNAIGMVHCIQAWLEHKEHSPGQFIAIVSNSATIPRTGSLAYCASKAAQAMALRVAAREEHSARGYIYGYAPGLVADTPMTQAMLPADDQAMHRMKGVGREGVSKYELAKLVASNVSIANAAFNGIIFPFDADEL